MTAPSIALVIEAVKTAIEVINQGNTILIHCHAGFGRTGIVAACILIVHENLTAEDAIAKVRSKRERSVQTSTQVIFVSNFEKFITKCGGWNNITPEMITALSSKSKSLWSVCGVCGTGSDAVIPINKD